MTQRALILAAHGSRHDPSVNDALRGHANRIAGMGLFHQVAVAFHQGEPTFAEVLGTVAGDEVSVVPVMTSDGYYSETVLPAALASHPRHGQVQVTITGTVGTHPSCVVLARERAGELLAAYNLEPDRTALLVVGHGTARHERSREATVGLANALREPHVFAEVDAVFLDEPPLVDGVVGSVGEANLIVLPFLIGAGHHATQDIPQRLGLQPPANAPFPIAGRVGRRFVVCDSALGTHPRIADVIVELAVEAHGNGRDGSGAQR